MQDNQNTNSFRTDSFSIASFLLANSCKLVKVDKTNPRHAFFIFEETDKIKQLTTSFLSFTAQIEPNKLISAQKSLKQLLYQE